MVGSDDYVSDYSYDSEPEEATDKNITPERNAELDDPIYPGSKLRRSESLLMVVAHSLRHDTSKEATDSLPQLIDAYLPEETVYPN